MPKFPQQSDGLHPSEGLLDLLAAPFAGGVARMSCGPTVNGTRPIASGLSDMWRDAHCPHRGDPRPRVVVLVGADGRSSGGQRQLAQHRDRGVAFSRAGRAGDGRVDDEAMAILGQQVRQITQLRFAPDRLLVQPRLRVRRRLMGVVPALLPVEIDRRILGLVGRGAPRSLRFETLVTGPRKRRSSVPCSSIGICSMRSNTVSGVASNESHSAPSTSILTISCLPASPFFEIWFANVSKMRDSTVAASLPMHSA